MPRWQTEQLARRAVGAVAARRHGRRPVHGDRRHRPGPARRRRTRRAGRGHATWTSGAVACARANGVEAYCGDLFAPLPGALEGQVDLVVAVVPYVPTPALALLQRDTLTFESPLSYDGGPDGTDILPAGPGREPPLPAAGRHGPARAGGRGGRLRSTAIWPGLGYVDVALLLDDDDDVRGLEATWSP